MKENQTNIRKNIENTNKKTFDKEYFTKGLELINQIEKEKILSLNKSNENDSKTNNDKNIKLTNIKRGRKLKHPKGNNLEVKYKSHRNVHDKFSDDNLKRKVKTHFHNYIIGLLNSKIKVKNEKKKLKFAKIQSSITQNITVKYNQNLINKKIKEILIDVSNKYLNRNINSECIDYVMRNSELNSSLVDLLNMTYKDMYLNYYLKSTISNYNGEPNESYEFHKEKLRKINGEEYLKKYIKNAENLILFFNNCKIRKKNKNNENLLKVPLMIELDESNENNSKKKNDNVSYYLYEKDINNKINYDEVEFLGDNVISRGTQTEMKQIDEESESEY